jgi:hypothetical protein
MERDVLKGSGVSDTKSRSSDASSGFSDFWLASRTIPHVLTVPNYLGLPSRI